MGGFQHYIVGYHFNTTEQTLQVVLLCCSLLRLDSCIGARPKCFLPLDFACKNSIAGISRGPLFGGAPLYESKVCRLSSAPFGLLHFASPLWRPQMHYSSCIRTASAHTLHSKLT